MQFRKITKGCVIQTFNDAGKFLRQKFIATDEVWYETRDGSPVADSEQQSVIEHAYHPFEMKNVNE